jgi:hypothetical protein
MRKRLTFANVVSSLALFFALTAGSYAAIVLPADSVGTRQLRGSAVTPAKLARGAVTRGKVAPASIMTDDIAPGAVTGSRVAAGSLTGADINMATLGKVPSASVADSASAVAREVTAVAPGMSAPGVGTTVTASCAAGLTVVGGGASLSSEDTEIVNDSHPSGSNGWTVDVFGATGASAAAFTVYAICLPATATT